MGTRVDLELEVIMEAAIMEEVMEVAIVGTAAFLPKPTARRPAVESSVHKLALSSASPLAGSPVTQSLVRRQILGVVLVQLQQQHQQQLPHQPPPQPPQRQRQQQQQQLPRQDVQATGQRLAT